jgi:hypothetical protein
VNHAAEAIPAPNPTGAQPYRRPEPAGRIPMSVPSAAQAHGFERPFVAVILHVLVEDPRELASTPAQHPMQALPPDGAQPRCANAFAFGAWIGVVMAWMPSATTTARVTLRSRSQTRDPAALGPAVGSPSRLIERARAR